jgi:DNA-binding NtrC family response regulator
MSEAALAVLTAYDWPGTVRQLESVIERTLLLSEGDVIVPEDLPAAVRAGIGTLRGPMDLEIPDSGLDLDELERSLILKALGKTAGNVSRAARLLGLSRRTLQYRIEKIQTGAAPDGTAAARKGAAAE